MESKTVDPDEIPDYLKGPIALVKSLRDAMFSGGEDKDEANDTEDLKEHKRSHELGFSPNDYTQKPVPVHAVQYHVADGADGDDNFLVVAKFCKDRGIAFAVTPRGCFYVAQEIGNPDVDRDILEDTDFLVYRPNTKQAAIVDCDGFRRDFEITEKEGENTEQEALADEGHTYPVDTHTFKPGVHKYLDEEENTGDWIGDDDPHIGGSDEDGEDDD